MAAKEVVLTPVLDTAIYAAGDYMGATGALPSVNVPSFSYLKPKRGKITQIKVIDLAKQKSAFDIMLFKPITLTSTFTQNGALTVAAADLTGGYIGVIPVVANDYSDFATNSVAIVNADLDFDLGSYSALKVCLVSRGTPTYAAASDMRIGFFFE